MIEALIVAFVIAALVWWVLAKLIGPTLVATGTPFLTTLGSAFVQGAALLGFIAGVLWFFGGGPIFGIGKH